MNALAQTRSVGVIGPGIAAFAAAAAVRRALPDAKVSLFTGGAPKPEYPGAAAPYIHQFHRLVGIAPEAFRRRTGAVTVREAEISRAGQSAFRLVPLSEVPHVDRAALHQLWLRRTRTDPSAGPAWADVARRAQRPEDRSQGLGARFHAEAYLGLLAELAGHLGVGISSERATSIELATACDLVIDASDPADMNPDCLRIDCLAGSVRWEMASAVARGEPVETVAFTDERVSWHTGAWRGLADAAGSRGLAGRVLAPWQGNVLAIGRAAVQCETFDGQPLAVALAGIVRALELLPRPGASGREAAEYNRRSGMVHDFLLDWAAERWDHCTQPAGLAALRTQFAQRGRVPFRDEDPVPPSQWIGWLLGSGERPRHIDLTAMAVPEERLAALFAGT